MILIAAMGNNRVIGSGDGMPWDVPQEFNQFLGLIEGQSVIMGRRSWEIFGSHMTSERNIVVSRSSIQIPGATVVDSIEAAVEIGQGFGKTVYSAGGAQIYAQTLPLADRMHLSIIKGEFAGDAHFPEFDPEEWEIVERRDHPDFEFLDYRRT
jgi:dihydrofolate reductase